MKIEGNDSLLTDEQQSVGVDWLLECVGVGQ